MVSLIGERERERDVKENQDHDQGCSLTSSQNGNSIPIQLEERNHSCIEKIREFSAWLIPSAEVWFSFIMIKGYTVKLNELNTYKDLKLSAKNKQIRT
jgi:hypothetical protein